jgi:hypothetical protein
MLQYNAGYRAGSFSCSPLPPHQMQERFTPTQDLFVLRHLGIPQLETDSWSLAISEINDLHAAYRRSKSFSNKVPGKKNSVMEREVKNATRSISTETRSEESEPEIWWAFHRKQQAVCRSVQLRAALSRKLVAHNRLRCGGFVPPIYHRSGSDPARVLECES